MERDFLNGIDEAFQRLMQANGNGRRNGGQSASRSSDRLIAEIMNDLQGLSKSQQEDVLKFVRSLKQEKVE
jgi:hypothetical protein